MDTAIISDPFRVPVTAQRIEDGRVIIRTPGKSTMILSASEVDRLARFAADKPELGRLERFPVPAGERHAE
jgi:hypothetical protein